MKNKKYFNQSRKPFGVLLFHPGRKDNYSVLGVWNPAYAKEGEAPVTIVLGLHQLFANQKFEK